MGSAKHQAIYLPARARYLKLFGYGLPQLICHEWDVSISKPCKRHPDAKMQDRKEKYKRKRNGWPMRIMYTATGCSCVAASTNPLNPGFTFSALERARKWMRFY